MLLEVTDLETHFHTDQGVVRALDGVTFEVPRRKTLGVVGESGCGKSVTALSIMRLLGANGKIVNGKIILHRSPEEGGDVDLTALDPNGREIRSIRGKDIAMIFQEPMTSLSPIHTVGNQIIEAIMLHQSKDEQQAREQAAAMLERVGISRPQERLDDYPFELSGGMRQRVMIAMALSCNPKLLIADEPTTALDVTVQAQILALMRELQEEFGMAIMMITHNLGVVAEMADNVVVMYLGRIVESTTVDGLFYEPLHPYTQALLRSIPVLGRRKKEKLESIEGMVPDAYNIPPGCSFHPRCAYFKPGVCDREVPELIEVSPGHKVSCFLYGEVEKNG